MEEEKKNTFRVPVLSIMVDSEDNIQGSVNPGMIGSRLDDGRFLFAEVLRDMSQKNQELRDVILAAAKLICETGSIKVPRNKTAS